MAKITWFWLTRNKTLSNKYNNHSEGKIQFYIILNLNLKGFKIQGIGNGYKEEWQYKREERFADK